MVPFKIVNYPFLIAKTQFEFDLYYCRQFMGAAIKKVNNSWRKFSSKENFFLTGVFEGTSHKSANVILKFTDEILFLKDNFLS